MWCLNDRWHGTHCSHSVLWHASPRVYLSITATSLHTHTHTHVGVAGSSDPAEAEMPLNKNTLDCVCTIDMGYPSKVAGSSDYVDDSAAEPSRWRIFFASMASSFAASTVLLAFNPGNTFATNHKQAQNVWTNSWCGVALSEWLFISVLALCYSLYLRRTSRVIGLLVAMCSLSGAVLGLVVLRFSTDEQLSHLKALLLACPINLCFGSTVCVSIVSICLSGQLFLYL